MLVPRRLSIVIPTYRATAHLECCVRSLVRSTRPDGIEVCLYGDGGGRAAERAIYGCARALTASGFLVRATAYPENLGITAAVNRAALLATGDWLLFVNDDMLFTRGWLEGLRRHLAPERVLSLTCLEPDVPGRRSASCFFRVALGAEPASLDLDALDGVASRLAADELVKGVNYPFACERSLFDAVGGADERFSGPGHDPDLFLRFRLAGAELLRTRASLLYHFSGASLRHEGASAGHGPTRAWVTGEWQGRRAFIQKWGDLPHARFGQVPRIPVPGAAGNRLRSKALLGVEAVRYGLRLARSLPVGRAAL